MIISRTPLRISFGGGGSDIPAYYKQHGGAVISTAINKYIYITVNKKFDGKIRASYSKTEIVNQVSELQHELIKACLSVTGIRNSIEITSISDIPSEGTGLGSSSSYVVGLLHALYAYKGKHVTAKQLAEEACSIEIDMLKKPIGKQDQYIAAYGGFQIIRFHRDESVAVDPIICSLQTKKRLQKHIMLFYTGITRLSNTILREQTQALQTDKIVHQSMEQMVEYALAMAKAIQINNDIRTFSHYVHKSWLLKQSLVKNISSPAINRWYSQGISQGAYGGKILGAGGGGFLLFIVPPAKQITVKQKLSVLEIIPCQFEPQGSKIIFVE